MKITLIRHATVIVELAGRRILVDPMLDPAGARPPIDDTPNPVRNPTTPLPVAAEEVVRGLDAVIVTHRHRDHLDGTAEQLLPRDVPVFCQPEDEVALAQLGLDARPVGWDGLRLVRTGGRHGAGALADALGPVSGFVLGDLYLAGDSVERPTLRLGDLLENRLSNARQEVREPHEGEPRPSPPACP